MTERRVLVIEDDQTLRDTIAEALTEDGYEVWAASNGAAALAIVQRWQPDLVILDLMMPRLDGEGFCAALRRIDGMAGVPIVVVSASRAAAEVSARIGAAAALSKPFDLLELTRSVDLLMSSRARKDTRESLD
jgi:DNA-binding response OmpR family regulator